MDYRQRLLKVAAAYADASKLSLARVATLITGGGVFFKRLEDGSGCTVASYEKALQWFSDRWPADVDWPSETVRPPKRDLDGLDATTAPSARQSRIRITPLGDEAA